MDRWSYKNINRPNSADSNNRNAYYLFAGLCIVQKECVSAYSPLLVHVNVWVSLTGQRACKRSSFLYGWTIQYMNDRLCICLSAPHFDIQPSKFTSTPTSVEGTSWRTFRFPLGKASGQRSQWQKSKHKEHRNWLENNCIFRFFHFKQWRRFNLIALMQNAAQRDKSISPQILGLTLTVWFICYLEGGGVNNWYCSQSAPNTLVSQPVNTCCNQG